MKKEDFLKVLRSNKEKEIIKVLKKIKLNFPKLKEGEKIELLEGVFSLFYLDLFDKPEFEGVIKSAMEVLEEFGKDKECLKWLCSQLKETDLKASLNLARLLGKIGAPSIPFLFEIYNKEKNPYVRSMAIHSLSKIKEKEVLNFLSIIIDTLKSEDDELRDTGARTLGKFFENFKKEDFKDKDIDESFNLLLKLTGDPKAPIRAKAFRSLGKMAKYGFIDENKKEKLKESCLKALGKTSFQWDNAYICRVEAEETLSYL